MPKIRVPANVQIVDQNGNPASESPTCAQVVCNVLLVDPKFLKTYSAMKVAAEIREKFLGAKPGDAIDLTNDQHEKLEDAVREPTSGFGAGMLQCLSYLDAIAKPEEK